jgi:hypothetical protein
MYMNIHPLHQLMLLEANHGIVNQAIPNIHLDLTIIIGLIKIQNLEKSTS